MAKTSSSSGATVEERSPIAFRRAGWVAAAVALLAGLFGLIFPEQALTFLSLLIGLYLIVSGITRIGTALTTRRLTGGLRLALGIVGALVVVAGVLVLNFQATALVFLVIVTGIGWIIDGIGYLVAAFTVRDRDGLSAGAFAVPGVVLIVAGIVLLVVPVGALGGVLFLVSVLLVIIGALGLLLMGVATARARKAGN